MPSAQQLVTRVQTLASLPSVYVLIQHELNSPDSSISQVARIASTDSALTARLLKIVNSALYSYDREIDSVDRAITILGLQQVHDLVLMLSVSAAFDGLNTPHLNMCRFWRNSLTRALTARNIARECRQPASGRLFTIGLLSDIGHLVLFQTESELTEQAWKQAETENLPLFEAEQKLIGCHFAEVGAALLERWSLPPAFAAAIGAQTNPRLGGKFAHEAAIIHVAAQFAGMSDADTAEQVISRISPVIWAQLGIKPDRVTVLYEEALQNLNDYFALFFPKLA